MLLVGFIFFVFPSAFSFWTSRQITTITSKSDFGPIRIDTQLLGSRHPKPAPLRILIPSVTIDLPIAEAKVSNGYWEVFETTAGHGIGSANPGEPGNTVIFAHARQGLFLPLKDVKKDAQLYILTDTRWHRYRVAEIKEVRPQDIEVIAPTPDEILTLFTCSGFLDSKRLIVVAKPIAP